MSSTHNQGHMAPMTDPERVNSYIIRHLARFSHGGVWMAGVERTLLVGRATVSARRSGAYVPVCSLARLAPLQGERVVSNLEQKQAGRA